MEKVVRMTCIGTVAGVGSQKEKEVAVLIPVMPGIIQELRITTKRGLFQQGKHYEWPCIRVLADLIEKEENAEVSSVKVGGRPISPNTLAIAKLMGGYPNGLSVKRIAVLTDLNYNQVYNALYHYRGVIFAKNGLNDWALIERKKDERQREVGTERNHEEGDEDFGGGARLIRNGKAACSPEKSREVFRP
jgi:hypothetical protein